MRKLTLILMVGLMAGCGSGGAAPKTDMPAGPTVTGAPAPDATADTGSEGMADKVREILIPFQDAGSTYAEALIVVEVKNTGAGWIELLPSSSDWTIYGADDAVITTGGFVYAYPTYLAPGATGYLAEHAVVNGVRAKTFKRVETTGQYAPVDAADAIVLMASKTKNRLDSGETITAGTITNKSDQDVQSAHVGAFYFDAKGKLLGFSSTNLVENLRAGKSKGFVTLGEHAFKGTIAKTVVLAGSD